MTELTPRQIVAELDKYIVGQAEAKKSVAVALRNRWRAARLDESLKEDIVPKNILMIGSTGVGKTEIARRLARLVDAPFVKVEATKFTEVGYVGRDVDSIVRDLAHEAVRSVHKRRLEEVEERAAELAEERIIDALVPESGNEDTPANPLARMMDAFTGGADSDEKPEPEPERKLSAGRAFVKKRLARGELEEELIEIRLEKQEMPQMMGMFAGPNLDGIGDDLQDMLGKLVPKKKKNKKVTVAQARKIFRQEEAEKLIDMDNVIETAIKQAEQSGIVFIDEIDKVAARGGAGGADVSREGVQRDILPIVEGSTVSTKYGPVKTDHVLFIAAGAFHVSKPSDLIPELQGRFPIRVELDSLKKEDFVRILTEPKNALVKQYVALLATEGVTVEFADSAIHRLARMAEDVNAHTENIGARRLHTLLEKLLEELSFEAPDLEDKTVVIDGDYVENRLKDITVDSDLSRFIL